MAIGTGERRTYTLGQVCLALGVLLGIVGGIFALSDRFATAASLAGLTTRVDRIEDKLDGLILRLGPGRDGR